VCEVSDPVVRGRPPNLCARHELRLQRLAFAATVARSRDEHLRVKPPSSPSCDGFTATRDGFVVGAIPTRSGSRRSGTGKGLPGPEHYGRPNPAERGALSPTAIKQYGWVADSPKLVSDVF
jgi:hypothetical protein